MEIRKQLVYSSYGNLYWIGVFNEFKMVIVRAHSDHNHLMFPQRSITSVG